MVMAVLLVLGRKNNSCTWNLSRLLSWSTELNQDPGLWYCAFSLPHAVPIWLSNTSLILTQLSYNPWYSPNIIVNDFICSLPYPRELSLLLWDSSTHTCHQYLFTMQTFLPFQLFQISVEPLIIRLFKNGWKHLMSLLLGTPSSTG